MSNRETLKPQAHVLTVEEQSKGGKASVQARRERKELRERLEVVLELPSANDPSMTNAEAMCRALVDKALEGDVRAFTVVRDTIGETPVNSIELVPAEEDINRAAFARLYEIFYKDWAAFSLAWDRYRHRDDADPQEPDYYGYFLEFME